MKRRIYKLLYRLGILRSYDRIDRLRYLNRLMRGKKGLQDEWAYADSDFRQLSRSDILICSPFRGTLLFFHCNPGNKVEGKIIADGLYSPSTLDFLEYFLAPGGIFIDIGANIGSFAIPLAKAHPEIEVHAYEPNPAAVGRFRKNISFNGVRNIVLSEAAAGGQAGLLEFNAFESGDLGISSFLSPRKKGSQKIAVKTVRLDDLYAGEEKPVSLIKIDTQGFEGNVLSGARELIRRHHPAILLEHEDSLFLREKEAETIKRGLRNFFADTGYEVFYLSRKDPFMLFPVQWDQVLNGDLLALTPEKPSGERV